MGIRTDIGSYLGDAIALIDTAATYSSEWRGTRGPSDIITSPTEYARFAGTLCTTAAEVSASTWINCTGFDSLRLICSSAAVNSTQITTWKLYTADVTLNVNGYLTAPTTSPYSTNATYGVLTSETSATSLSVGYTHKVVTDEYDVTGIPWVFATVQDSIASESTATDIVTTFSLTRRI